MQQACAVSYRGRNQGHPPPQSTSIANVVGTSTGFAERRSRNLGRSSADAEITESFSILEADAEKSRVSQDTYFLREWKMAYIAADSNRWRSFFDTCT